MRHVLSNGSTIHLSQPARQLFSPIKCTIDGHLMQSNGISTSLQQSLPFLHASGLDLIRLEVNFVCYSFSDGKIQVNPDGSVVLEGHIFILNSIHSFLGNKILKQQSNSPNPLDSLDLRSGNLVVKVMSGKLLEQNVEGVL